MKSGTRGKLNILVVDDSRSIRELLMILLSHEGYRCESAVNGVEAMEKATQRCFHAVVTDVQMPGMDGIKLTEELTRHFVDLPVMIITAHVDECSRQSALAAGAKEVLRKPFAIPEFMMRLHKMLHVQEPVREQRG